MATPGRRWGVRRVDRRGGPRQRAARHSSRHVAARAFSLDSGTRVAEVSGSLRRSTMSDAKPCCRTALLALVAIIALVAGDAPPGEASLRQECRLQCGAAISACVTSTGQSVRTCKKQVRLRCRQEGLHVCSWDMISPEGTFSGLTAACRSQRCSLQSTIQSQCCSGDDCTGNNRGSFQSCVSHRTRTITSACKSELQSCEAATSCGTGGVTCQFANPPQCATAKTPAACTQMGGAVSTSCSCCFQDCTTATTSTTTTSSSTSTSTSTTTTTLGMADLSLTKSALPTHTGPNADTPVTFTVTLHNAGPATATGVEVTDILDPSL